MKAVSPLALINKKKWSLALSLFEYIKVIYAIQRKDFQVVCDEMKAVSPLVLVNKNWSLALSLFEYIKVIYAIQWKSFQVVEIERKPCLPWPAHLVLVNKN